MTDPVALWQDRLKTRVGMDDDERERLREWLLAFCTARDVAPEDLLARWQSYPELTVRRRPGATETPQPAVESFLIHNGVNVFGDIVCVPGRPEDLATQGRQFVPPTP